MYRNEIFSTERDHKRVLIFFFNIQLILPKETQPRWGHTATAFTLSPGIVEVTMFGGSPKLALGGDIQQHPKITETTVVRLGEQIPYMSL